MTTDPLGGFIGYLLGELEKERPERRRMCHHCNGSGLGDDPCRTCAYCGG